MQHDACCWAEKFNLRSPRTITMAPAVVVQRVSHADKPFLTLEPLLEGAYRKYNSNQASSEKGRERE